MIRYKQQERKRPARVINKKSQNRQGEKKLPKSNAASGFYYSFLTVILLLCLIQITISAVLNVSKIISYNAKIIQITKSRNHRLQNRKSALTYFLLLSHHIPDNLEPNQACSIACVYGRPDELLGVIYGWGSFDLHGYCCLLYKPCCLDCSGLPNYRAALWCVFSLILFPCFFSFLSQKGPRTLFCAWTSIIRIIASHATKLNRHKKILFRLDFVV